MQRKVYTLKRRDRSVCTQRQPESAALKAAIRTSDPKGGGQPAIFCVNDQFSMFGALYKRSSLVDFMCAEVTLCA